MLLFESNYDLRKLNMSQPFNRIMKDLFSRKEHLEGYLVFIEEGDISIDLPVFVGRIKDIEWEGVAKSSGFYHAVYLTNNEFVLEFIMPDREWLPAEIRENLDVKCRHNYLI